MCNLLRIDELLMGEHGSLSPDDECYFLMEYTARAGFSFSRSNDLIQNLKKSMDRRGRPEWKWKLRAIGDIARDLHQALPTVVDFATTTIIPIPPSKARTNSLYDDRVTQILLQACPPDADLRELIICRQDMTAAHESQDRPTVEQILDNFAWNEPIGTPLRQTVVLFDDMITGGNHFVASRRFIEGRFPGRRVIGVFAARRAVLQDDPFDDWPI